MRKLNLSDFKKELCEAVTDEIAPIRDKFLELKDDKTYLKEILHNGMIKAREKSDPVIEEVKSIVGLG